MHPQELVHGHMKRSLNHLGNLAGNDSCIWEPYVGPIHGYMKHSVSEEFILAHHGVWEHISKECKFCSICNHKHNNDHKFVVARWEALHVHLIGLVFICIMIKMLWKSMQGFSLAWRSCILHFELSFYY